MNHMRAASVFYLQQKGEIVYGICLCSEAECRCSIRTAGT